MTIAGRFVLGGAVELEQGVGADFPDSLRDRRLLIANGDFPLVFVAAQFALYCHASTFPEHAGEVSQLPERDAAMPFRTRFPTAGVILPRGLAIPRKAITESELMAIRIPHRRLPAGEALGGASP
jgi:hypothetical protein